MAYIGTTPKDIRSFGKAKFDFTASQGQTAFTGVDDDGKTLGFTDGQISVYVNGILMDDSDYTTSNSNTVTLTAAANASDIISVVALQTDIPNSDYVPATGGTFSGDVEINGDLTVDTNTLYVDSTNYRVGVGTSSPSGAQLDIFTGSSTADGLKINRYASGVYYSTLRQDSHGLAIHVGDGSSIAERVAITPNGITFNGDTAAANALDDYEEGTWTPTSLVNGFTVSLGYFNVPRYVKIGKIVHVTFDMVFGSATYASGYSWIGGLPFGSATTAVHGWYGSGTISGNAAGGPLYIGSGNTSVYLFQAINSNVSTTWNVGFTYETT